MEQTGLYQKYKVSRNDDKEITDGCFVLELKDPNARKAILAYATAVEDSGGDKDLAQDLKSWVAKVDPSMIVAPSKATVQVVTTTEAGQTMLFDRIVLIKGSDTLDDDSLYIVSPDEVEDYACDQDLRLPAKVVVEVDSYIEYQNNQY